MGFNSNIITVSKPINWIYERIASDIDDVSTLSTILALGTIDTKYSRSIIVDVGFSVAASTAKINIFGFLGSLGVNGTKLGSLDFTGEDVDGWKQNVSYFGSECQEQTVQCFQYIVPVINDLSGGSIKIRVALI